MSLIKYINSIKRIIIGNNNIVNTNSTIVTSNNNNNINTNNSINTDITNINNTSNKGFTLLEVLLVIAIIAILTAIVIIALNPAKNVKDAHATQRIVDTNTIWQAVEQYGIDNDGIYPTEIDTTLRMIGTATDGCDVKCGDSSTTTPAECIDLDPYLVSKYIAGMPFDPALGSTERTYYAIRKTPFGRIKMTECYYEEEVGPVKISNCAGLQSMENDLAKDYALINDIDCLGFDYGDGQGFMPIGNLADKFTGTLDGGGFTVSNLYINRETHHDVGLFGYTDGAQITNLKLANIDITGGKTDPNIFHTGSVAGIAINGSIVSNCFATGTLKAAGVFGGLVGYLAESTIEKSCTDVSMTTTSSTTSTFFGGLAGVTYYGDIKNTCAKGNLVGTGGRSPSRVGGLIGHQVYGVTRTSYATGNVSSPSPAYVGGLIGLIYNPAFVGVYWDTQTSAQSSAIGTYGSVGSSAGTYGRTTAQMQQQATFSGWNFIDVWAINEGVSYPYLIE